MPAIASYSSTTSGRVQALLTDEYLRLVAKIATSSVRAGDVSEQMRNELREMHVISEDDGTLRLSTAVFAEVDIRKVISLASELGRELAGILVSCGSELMNAPAEVRNFLGGIIGVGQGTGRLLREAGNAVDWRSYGGRYAQTKVDFDEICDTRESLGDDLQNKSILRGEQYTAVFIGPGGSDYRNLMISLWPKNEHTAYRDELLRYLTDSYAALIGGRLQSEALRRMAEEVGLFRNGEPAAALIDEEMFRSHLPVVRRISDFSCRFYSARLDQIGECLRSTTSGRQGVEPANMMMHFWRYCRRVLARELYASGFFTDQVPVTGSMTVFYDNRIRELRQLLG